VNIFKLEEMKGGWFVGDFSPVAHRTAAAEVACKNYKAGASEPRHVHKIATELTLLVSGKVQMNGRVILPGEIVLLAPGESADFTALQDSITVVVKTPSVHGDKYPMPAEPGRPS
jgi:hypothetical protein